MPWKPPSLARVLAQVSLGALCLLGVAEAAVPLSLPPGERSADWQAAAVRAGFSLEPLGAGVGVELIVVGAGWEIRVHDAQGGVRRVPVAAPKTPREREDLLWVAASLAVPLESQAPSVPLPVIPITPPAPTPPPPATATTARPPARRAPEPAPTSTEAPPAEPPAEPVAPAVATPSAPPEAPEPATVEPSPGALKLAPYLAAGGGLTLGGALEEAQVADLTGRGELTAGVLLEERWLITVGGAAYSASSIGLLGETEEIHRLDLTLGGGLALGGDWGPWIQPRLGLGLLRFSSGEPATALGGLRVPTLGLCGGLARELGGGLAALGELGLDRDLRAVRLVKEDGSASVLLPPSHLFVGLGLRWSPE